ncbi:hypothetical protein [Candidatus Regiella endosymbiont of Tuberolachnus salignus]|uniref:hypothetical protein n=1 Tax=Candidatus Regiella endosymbiont of Tuberolachnus salignus TaxID=3077956 RepID=UPI0030CC7E96
MIRSRKNSAHRLLAVMLLLWGLVSESRAQEIEIKAEFRPSLLNRGQDGFQNRTESTGICAPSSTIAGQCKAKKIFSIELPGDAMQSKDIPANGEERDSIYVKFPAPPGNPLDIKLQDKDSKPAKEPAQFTITRFGASYRDRFYVRIKENRAYGWGTNEAWVDGSPERSDSKPPSCLGTQGIGHQESGSYGAYHFIWEMSPNGICVKKSHYARPKNNTESLSYYANGGAAPEAPNSNKSRCLAKNPECVATLRAISFAYALKLPSPLSMASGTYTNVDTLAFTIGNSTGDDIDFGNNFRWDGDQNVTLKFKLEVAHDLKVTPEFGAEKVILVPQDGSQRGWDRYLSGGSKPTKLTGRSKFRLSSSGEFTVYLQCEKNFNKDKGECALTSEKHKNKKVPVSAFLTLASNIVQKDTTKSVTAQKLYIDKNTSRNIFHTNSPAQNYPGHIDFEVSGKEHIDTLLTDPPDTYKGNVTIVFDANIHN